MLHATCQSQNWQPVPIGDTPWWLGHASGDYNDQTLRCQHYNTDGQQPRGWRKERKAVVKRDRVGEFPAETMSLQRRVEKFSRSEGRTTAPHHCGYSSNVQFSRPTERAAPPHSNGDELQVNPLFTVEAFLNFVAPYNFSLCPTLPLT
ncbi:hypothetical protein CRENBAI_013843 [Crenichthys baileyi]|uniref:Uncharacterized protein n=1 Tax=Crenichthys baileyi TaxID=28760 RepID=A0AAV9SEE0_9TELE